MSLVLGGWGLALLERGWLPDSVIRAGIRRILAARLREQHDPDPARRRARLQQFVRDRRAGPIAIDPAAANAQHYELPAEVFARVLGRHMKYSSAFWDAHAHSLHDAEAAMLALAAERAQLSDGQRVLELGCGWGSWSLWMARHFPASRILGVSNSASQKAWIDAQARRDGLSNLEIVTADMNVFDVAETFDRIVSVEMFEHMRNWQALLEKVTRWLADDGKVFIHIFAHREYAYPYEVRDASDWMAAHFFTGGIMPSDRLLYEFSDVVSVEEHWRINGTHYQKTAEAWLANLDRHRADLWPVFERVYGVGEARRWWIRWRVFFMACAELWGWRGGEEWIVSHYRLTKAAGRPTTRSSVPT